MYAVHPDGFRPGVGPPSPRPGTSISCIHGCRHLDTTPPATLATHRKILQRAAANVPLMYEAPPMPWALGLFFFLAAPCRALGYFMILHAVFDSHCVKGVCATLPLVYELESGKIIMNIYGWIILRIRYKQYLNTSMLLRCIKKLSLILYIIDKSESCRVHSPFIYAHQKIEGSRVGHQLRSEKGKPEGSTWDQGFGFRPQSFSL